MGINIGDNNKIEESIIGNNNKKEEKSKVLKKIISWVAGIVSSLIVAFLVYKFGWNK